MLFLSNEQCFFFLMEVNKGLKAEEAKRKSKQYCLIWQYEFNEIVQIMCEYMA